MDPEGLNGDFPCLPSSKRASFALHSGGREIKNVARIPASPVTPNFKSDFLHGILGAQQSMVDAFSSLSSTGVAPIPSLDLKKSAIVSIEKLSAQSNLCCDGLISENSAGFRSAVGGHDELALAGVMNSKEWEHESGAVGCNFRHEAPVATPGCNFGPAGYVDDSGQHQKSDLLVLPSSGTAVLVDDLAPPSDMAQVSQIKAPSSSAVIGHDSGKCDEKLRGRSWSSVVTQCPLGGFSFIVVGIF